MSAEVFRWGIAGAGGIAAHFARGLRQMPGMRLSAIASRDLQKAEKFTAEFGAELAFGSYSEMFRSGKIDAVYLATVNSDHCESLLAAIDAGVPVLCEKPMLMTLADFDRVRAAAAKKRVALMEAMWTAFLPSFQTMKRALNEDRIGEPRLANISFCVDFGEHPNPRLYEPALGGGLIYDIGVYNLHVALGLFGDDYLQVQAAGVRGKTGVDIASSIALVYPQGLLVNTLTADVNGPFEIKIFGTRGTLTAHAYNGAQSVQITVNGETDTIACPYEINGFEYEIRAFAAVVREGRTESDRMPLARTRKVIELMAYAVSTIAGNERA